MNRRNFFQSMMTGLVASKALAGPLATLCNITPEQTSGPFYPDHEQEDKDNDLTIFRGATGPALGQRIYITGTVTDEACRAVPNAVVEIWQACASGKYNHHSDPNPAPLDPNFQYWGIATTDSAGQYTFKTIMPGNYPAGDNWIRPSHIHYKVHCLGFHELTTQMYFDGNPLNDKDLILQGLPAAERKVVIVKLNEPPAESEPGAKACRFDLTLKKVQAI